MVYAHRADIYDADTHMMEPPTWLAEFADAKLRPHLTPFGQSKPAAIEKAEQALSGFAKRQQNPDLAAEIEASFMALTGCILKTAQSHLAHWFLLNSRSPIAHLLFC